MAVKFFQIVLLILGLLVVGNGQEKRQLTELEGTVIDQAGAVISSTKIVLINNVGEKFSTLTNDDGIYSIKIPSGTYMIEAEYTNHRAWEKFRIEKYEIASTKKMVLDISLRVDENFTKANGDFLTVEPTKVKKKRKSN